MRREPASVDSEREGSLNLLAGPDTARADDAFRRIEGEIGIALVLRFEARIDGAIGSRRRNMILAGKAVAHMLESHRLDHLEHLASGLGWMVGQGKLHHSPAQFRQAI